MADTRGRFKGVAGVIAAAGAVLAAPMLFGFGHLPTTMEPLNSWYVRYVPLCEPTFVGDCLGHTKIWSGHFDGAAIYAVVLGVVLAATTARRAAGWLQR